MSSRADVAEFWNGVVSGFFTGGKPHVENPDLRTWFDAYSGGGSGSVTTEAFPEPYIGPLAAEHGEPRIIALGLNPGPADLNFQGRGGIFEREIRDRGTFADWAVTEPYLRRPWRDRHPRNPYHESLRTFAQRWLNDYSVRSRDVLVLELFPWHSDKVTAAMRPDVRLIERYVWNPLAEMNVPIIFGFGSHWLPAAQALGLATQDVKASFSTSQRWLRVFALPSGQRLAVVWQSGYSGPPGAADTEALRRALDAAPAAAGAAPARSAADHPRTPTVNRASTAGAPAVISTRSSTRAAMRTMTWKDLVTAVNELRSANTPIVLAHRIKDWCVQNQIDGGADHYGYQWNLLDEASKEAQSRGQLQKWKSGSHRSAPVGWSFKDQITLAEAKTWALNHGWQQKWD